MIDVISARIIVQRKIHGDFTLFLLYLWYK